LLFLVFLLFFFKLSNGMRHLENNNRERTKKTNQRTSFVIVVVIFR